jgi:hypothetical protein
LQEESEEEKQSVASDDYSGDIFRNNWVDDGYERVVVDDDISDSPHSADFASDFIIRSELGRKGTSSSEEEDRLLLDYIAGQESLDTRHPDNPTPEENVCTSSRFYYIFYLSLSHRKISRGYINLNHRFRDSQRVSGVLEVFYRKIPERRSRRFSRLNRIPMMMIEMRLPIIMRVWRLTMTNLTHRVVAVQKILVPNGHPRDAQKFKGA